MNFDQIHIYIVRRESADGPQNDVFTDFALAQEWANIIGAERVEEEPIIDRSFLDEMKRAHEVDEETISQDDSRSPEEITS
jgi:hypothetical protein